MIKHQTEILEWIKQNPFSVIEEISLGTKLTISTLRNALPTLVMAGLLLQPGRRSGSKEYLHPSSSADPVNNFNQNQVALLYLIDNGLHTPHLISLRLKTTTDQVVELAHSVNDSVKDTLSIRTFRMPKATRTSTGIYRFGKEPPEAALPDVKGEPKDPLNPTESHSFTEFGKPYSEMIGYLSSV